MKGRTQPRNKQVSELPGREESEGRGPKATLGFGCWRSRKADTVGGQKVQKEGPGVGRARSQRSAGHREWDFKFVLQVRGQQAFSVKGHIVNNLDLAGHKHSVTTT